MINITISHYTHALFPYDFYLNRCVSCTNFPTKQTHTKFYLSLAVNGALQMHVLLTFIVLIYKSVFTLQEESQIIAN